MTDLVSQLVGALEKLALAFDVAEDGCTNGGFGPGYENGHGIECGPLIQAARAEARAALTAAKAGGWVAVPVEPTPEMLRAGHESVSCVGSCGEASPPEVSDFCDVWIAMLAARPTTPPKEQA